MDAEQRASALIENSLVWDTHSGFMPDPAADLDNLSIWSRAGVDYLSINVGFDLMPWQECVRTVANFRHRIIARPDLYRLASTADDIAAAVAERRLAVSFDLEGMAALDERIEMVEFYHHLGVRQMHFAYNRNSAAGGGCHDEDCGLTAFGRSVIEEMNRVGMFVDVSHAGYRTSMDAMAHSAQPVIFSHSNAKAVAPHGRNITDEQIRACAATGGVIGVNGIDLMLGREAPLAQRMADHIDHIVAVAGPDHVGLGLDYGFPVEVADIDEIVAKNPEYWPVEEGYHDGSISFLPPGDLPQVVAILIERGYDGDTLKGILGGNFLRVAKIVWK
ncbi:membrane dipeptidase [Sphingobium sp. AP50]|nr:membrane dipeptidase [Sphingobium sp. AP50]